MASKTRVLWFVCSMTLFAAVELRMTYEKVIRVEKHYIVFDEDHATWSQAFHECQRRGLELLSLESREENEFVQKLIRLPDLPSAPPYPHHQPTGTPYPTLAAGSSHLVLNGFWTSGRLDQDGYWRWASIGRLLSTWTDWAPGQPHVAIGGSTPDACLRLSDRYQLQWDAISCDSRLGFICQTRSGPGVAGFPATRLLGEERVVQPEVAPEIPPHVPHHVPAEISRKVTPNWPGAHRPEVHAVPPPPLEVHLTAPHDTSWLPHASPGNVQLDAPPVWVTDWPGYNRSIHHYPVHAEHQDTSNWLAGFTDERHPGPDQEMPEVSTSRHQLRSELSPEPRGPILALSDRVYSFHLSGNVTWDEALWACRLLDATLATVPDGQHNLRVTEFIAMQELDKLEFWLDGRLVRTPNDPNGIHNHWLWWSSGLPIGPDTNWAPNRPKLSEHDEDRCLVLGVGNADWRWTNDVCCHRRPFICQHPGPLLHTSDEARAIDLEKKLFREQ